MFDSKELFTFYLVGGGREKKVNTWGNIAMPPPPMFLHGNCSKEIVIFLLLLKLLIENLRDQSLICL